MIKKLSLDELLDFNSGGDSSDEAVNRSYRKQDGRYIDLDQGSVGGLPDARKLQGVNGVRQSREPNLESDYEAEHRADGQYSRSRKVESRELQVLEPDARLPGELHGSSTVGVDQRRGTDRSVGEARSRVAGGEHQSTLIPASANLPASGESVGSGVDVASLLKRGFELCVEQAQMGTNPGMQDAEAIILANLRSDTFVNSITNAMTVGHLSHIAEAGDTQFQRRKEMEVYNPMLDAFSVASEVVNEKIHYVARQIKRTMGRLKSYEHDGVYLDKLGSVNPNAVGNVSGWANGKGTGGEKKDGEKKGGKGGQDWYDGEFEEDESDMVGEKEVSPRQYITDRGEVKEFEEGAAPNELLMHLDGLQYLFDKSLGNMQALTNGIDALVKSERHSGARPWGNSRNGIPTMMQPWGIPKRSGIGGGGGGKEEMRALLNGGSAGGAASGEVIERGVSGGVVREMSEAEIFSLLEKQKEENLKNGGGGGKG